MAVRETRDRYEGFTESHKYSLDLFHRASRVMPGGLSHNFRMSQPFPVYIKRGEGPYIWDEDGNKYIDYDLGGASQILGHAAPVVVEELRRELSSGTGAASCNEREVVWAELVQELIPSAESVRFTASGTEATLLALRVARAFTQRSKILRIQGHYHGWHDYMMVGHRDLLDRPASAGIPSETLDSVLVAPLNDTLISIQELLSKGDVAGIILEPGGLSWGTVPLPPSFLEELRKLAEDYGALLIFDEVITGFRVGAGGVQKRTGITPDLTTLGKILTGGLPGGALAGKTEFMDLISPWESSREPYVFHRGTFNGNPLSAAAGIATLRQIRSANVSERAEKLAAELRSALSDVFELLSLQGFVYGDSSMFHMYLVSHSDAARHVSATQPQDIDAAELMRIPGPMIDALHCELRLRGVELLSYNGGVTSSSHGAETLERTTDAVRDSLRVLRDSKVIAAS